MLVFLLVCNILFSLYSMDKIDSVYPDGSYDIDLEFFESFYSLCQQYQQKCDHLSKEASWFDEQLKNENFPAIKNKIQNSSNPEEYRITIDELEEIESASPRTKRKFVANSRFDEYAQDFKRRANFIKEILPSERQYIEKNFSDNHGQS